MASYIDWGKKIYDMNNPREVRRMAVFVARAIIHNTGVQKLISYFEGDAVRKKFIDENPFPIEQVTRAFFYKESTFSERADLVVNHVDYLTKKIEDDIFIDISSHIGKGYILWEQSFENGYTLKAILKFEAGQRKEGLCSIQLNLFSDGKYIDHFYQVMFWISKDKAKNISLYIGAMQGPNMTEAREIVKTMTKACHGYRTKNLILYITQAVVRSLSMQKIYAVTNEGYYANNHARIDRKLKTSFSDFWEEVGGEPSEDGRFYELPLVETRKTMEEVPTRKRAVYRRRFALLDEIDSSVTTNMKKILK